MTQTDWDMVPWPPDCPVHGLDTITDNFHHLDDIKRLLTELEDLTGYHPPVDKHLRLV